MKNIFDQSQNITDELVLKTKYNMSILAYNIYYNIQVNNIQKEAEEHANKNGSNIHQSRKEIADFVYEQHQIILKRQGATYENNNPGKPKTN